MKTKVNKIIAELDGKLCCNRCKKIGYVSYYNSRKFPSGTICSKCANKLSNYNLRMEIERKEKDATRRM